MRANLPESRRYSRHMAGSALAFGHMTGWTADSRPETGRSAPTVDETDRRIIAALRTDGRMSIRALAENLHISRAGAYARVERLQRDGVITGFTAVCRPPPDGVLQFPHL